MAEYMEREALLKRLCNDDPANMEDYYYNAIKNAPTVDVVEVVRCKDCKHLKNDTKYCKTHNKYYCELEDTIKGKNHYCAYGERKT